MRAPLVAKLIALALVSQSAYRWKLELVRVGSWGSWRKSDKKSGV